VTVKTRTRTFRCFHCGRKLKDGRWVFSRFTGNRYCLPYEGCAK
jgi:hypothetical protein